MKIVLTAALLLAATPSLAWEAGVEGTLCTLTHAEDGIDVRLTFDPSGPLYTITLTTPEPWPEESRFGMAFYGPQPNMIMTDAHELSEDRRSITVSDRGFGNVLDGLQFNEGATGFTGLAVAAMSLEGAAPAVEAFRACGETPSV
ncbi:hypothetical protein [Gymnodinialimonas hymeniacidonis]|uniref:hypothetical protein n=1 Tax=Gymnodinialimonas hymeniacidonis TaxID=3126508 RepID=UPI0034C629D4